VLPDLPCDAQVAAKPAGALGRHRPQHLRVRTSSFHLQFSPQQRAEQLAGSSTMRKTSQISPRGSTSGASPLAQPRKGQRGRRSRWGWAVPGASLPAPLRSRPYKRQRRQRQQVLAREQRRGERVKAGSEGWGGLLEARGSCRLSSSLKSAMLFKPRGLSLPLRCIGSRLQVAPARERGMRGALVGSCRQWRVQATAGESLGSFLVS